MITIGLDAGTTTISGAVYDSAQKKVLATRTLPNSAQVRTGKTWENLQDAQVIWEISQNLLDGFLQEYPKVGGVGLTGQMHGIVYVDGQGEAMSALATWQDARGDQPFRDGKTYAQILSERLGYRMASGYGLSTHFYNLHNGLVPDGAEGLCTIADYIGMRLCGREKPLVHASNAHSLGAFDLQRMGFDLEAIGKAGMDAGMLPEVAQGEALMGETACGIAVRAAIGDNQASFLGAAGEKSKVLANIGTSSQLSVRSKTLMADCGLDARPFVGGEYLLVGAGLCGGSAYAVLRDLLNEVLELYGVDAGETLYAKMEAAAREMIDAENPLSIDTRLRGTRTAPAERGAITRIGADNLTIGQLALGVMRGICEELYGFYRQVPEVLKGGEVLAVSGNALRQNQTLREVLARRFGMALHLSPYEEEGAVGAAMNAASVLP